MSNVLDELSREIEQAEAGLESFANSVSIFWNQLRKQGLTRKEATELSHRIKRHLVELYHYFHNQKCRK